MDIEEAKAHCEMLLDYGILSSEDEQPMKTVLSELEKKDKIINNSINEIEKIRQYFSEDLQVEFIRILEILKNKKVIDW